MAADVFKARLAAQTDLMREPDFDSKLKEISDRVTKNELQKLQKFDAAYFKGKSHFEEDCIQNYLVFQPMYRYFKRIAGVGSGNYMYLCKSKGLPDERLDSIPASNYKITPELSFYGTKTRVEFNGSCLKQDKVTYNHEKIVNIYIVKIISKDYNISSYPTLEICLFGAVSLTKNADIVKYKYSGYRIGFDRHGEFSFVNGFGKDCIIFGNKKNDILVLAKDFAQGINGTTIYAEKLCKINFTEKN